MLRDVLTNSSSLRQGARRNGIPVDSETVDYLIQPNGHRGGLFTGKSINLDLYPSVFSWLHFVQSRERVWRNGAGPRSGTADNLNLRVRDMPKQGRIEINTDLHITPERSGVVYNHVGGHSRPARHAAISEDLHVALGFVV